MITASAAEIALLDRIAELERELANERAGFQAAEMDWHKLEERAHHLERENAALREAGQVALHTVGKVLHGEGKDFRDLDHTYKMLIDVLPREVIEQPHVREHAPDA